MSLLNKARHLAPVWARYSDIFAERAEGAYIYSDDGRRYLDFTCGIGVTNTGHCHPRVVEAIRKQAGLLIHGQINIVYHRPILELVAALGPIMPVGLDDFFFSNSGAEAVEASLKLARQASGRSDIIAFSGGFHGRTYGAMAVTSSKSKYRDSYAPLPSGVSIAPFADPYRYALAHAKEQNPANISSDEFKDQACEDALRQLRYMLQTSVYPNNVAAMLIEPIQGEGGYVVPPLHFLRGIRDICDEIGAFLIIDEIQSGVGRTGRWWAHEYMDITPDIMVIAKGIASGMPISAIAARSAIMQCWRPTTHGGTYGCNAIACAAAVATINVIQEEGLLEQTARHGQLLLNGLHDLGKASRTSGRSAFIGDVRGLGLMIGVELVNADGSPAPEFTHDVLTHCREKGKLLLLNCGPYDNVVRFIPPLIATKEEIEQSIAIFADSINNK